MMRRANSGFLFLATLALLVAGSGCPNSEIVGSRNGSVLVSMSNTNSGSWAYASLSVDYIGIRPVDPEADDRQGNKDIQLLSEAVFMDNTLPSADPSFFSPVYVSPGTYRMSRIGLSQIYFDKFTGTSTTECDYIESFNSPVLLNPDLTFTVQPNTDGMLDITIDISAMAVELANSLPPSALFYPDCFGDMDGDILAATIGNYLTLD